MPQSQIRSSALFVLLGLLLAPLPGNSQTPASRALLVAPTCKTCKLVMTKIGILGAEGHDPDIEGGLASIKALSDGNLIAIVPRQQYIIVFTAQGKVLRRFGRKGEGPGETTGAKELFVGPNDSISVWDSFQSRLSVFNSAGKYVRSDRVPSGVSSFLPLGRTQFVVSGRVVQKDLKQRDLASVFPLHLFHGDSLSRSFGDAIEKINPTTSAQFHRFLLRAPDGVIAVPRVNHYVIDLWNETGTRLTARLVREPSWFLPSEVYVQGDPEQPNITPSSIIRGMTLDGRGLLWVYSSRARPTWRSAFGPAKPGEGGRKIFPLIDEDLYVEGMVEVFDLRKRTMLFSSSLPFNAAYMIGRGLVGAMRQQLDRTVIDVYRISLQQ